VCFFSRHIYRRIAYDLKSPVKATQGNLAHGRSPDSHHTPIRQDSISSDLSNFTVDSDGMILLKLKDLVFQKLFL
jgi:hypothetical protein